MNKNNSPERHKLVASVYLLLYQQDQILLYLRQNSGFEDGKYGLVSGHIERDEAPKPALVREAFEEANIIIDPKDLDFVHLSSRRSERENIDIFFECSKWQGAVNNNEPHKCADLSFFKLSNLPENLIGYIKDVIANSKKNMRYSEIDW